MISYPNFSGATGLQLNGVASLTGSSLQLTPAEEFTSGTAFSRSEIQTSGSFETEFELKMHGSNTLESFGTYADGIAFVLQPDSAEQLGAARRRPRLRGHHAERRRPVRHLPEHLRPARSLHLLHGERQSGSASRGKRDAAVRTLR